MFNEYQLGRSYDYSAEAAHVGDELPSASSSIKGRPVLEGEATAAAYHSSSLYAAQSTQHTAQNTELAAHIALNDSVSSSASTSARGHLTAYGEGVNIELGSGGSGDAISTRGYTIFAAADETTGGSSSSLGGSPTAVRTTSSSATTAEATASHSEAATAAAPTFSPAKSAAGHIDATHNFLALLAQADRSGMLAAPQDGPAAAFDTSSASSSRVHSGGGIPSGAAIVAALEYFRNMSMGSGSAM